METNGGYEKSMLKMLRFVKYDISQSAIKVLVHKTPKIPKQQLSKFSAILTLCD